MPVLFLGVVIGVAVLFRAGLELARAPAAEEPASVATVTPIPKPAAAPLKLDADPAAMPLPVEPPLKGKKRQRR